MLVEPLAFLAIFALYIEFPSIQDLIYTKICLQVVDNYAPPNNSVIMNSNNKTINSIQTHPYAILRSDTHLLCDRLNKTVVPKEIRQKIAEGDSLFWLKYQLIICLLCALSCPYWGGMSDKIGRLIPLNVPIVMSMLSNLISLAFGILISLNSHSMFSVEWLYVGAVMVGLSGGQAIVIVNSFSLISDNTSNESRSKRIAVLESVVYLAHSVGFYLTKHIMSLDLATPEWPWLNRHFVAFSLCVGLNIICILYSIFRLRHQKFHRFLNNFERVQQETFTGDSVVSICGVGNCTTISGSLRQSPMSALSVETITGTPITQDRLRELTASTPDDLDGPIARADKSWSKGLSTFLTFKYYIQTYATATKKRESRTIILLLLLSAFISAMSLATLMSLLYIFLHMEPFNWTTSQYSSWYSITSITKGVALICLTICMKFMKSWNVPDTIIAAVGFLSKGTGLLMIGLAQSSALIYWSLLAFVLSEYTMPPIRSLLSKLVVKEEVAKIYSCLAAAQSICFLIGNVVFYFAYTSLGLQSFFRLSFLVVAAFQFAAMIIMLVVYSTLRRRVIIV